MSYSIMDCTSKMFFSYRIHLMIAKIRLGMDLVLDTKDWKFVKKIDAQYVIYKVCYYKDKFFTMWYNIRKCYCCLWHKLRIKVICCNAMSNWYTNALH